jgi:hypothetical protein
LLSIDVFTATIVLLAIFLLLVIMGISESAIVATVIFTLHLCTMAVLIISGFQEQEISPSFLSDFEVLDRAYPEIDIEFIQLKGVFEPELIKQLSNEWNISTNFMFISSPGNRFSHRIADLHGARLII